MIDSIFYSHKYFKEQKKLISIIELKKEKPF